jgi:hypothetical protein
MTSGYIPHVSGSVTAHRIGGILSAAAPMLLIAGGLALDPDVSFNQWDNFEQLLPNIWTSQQRLLHGEFPHWNQFQGMGQVLHSIGGYGVLYPGYTLGALLVHLLGMGPHALFSVITILHAGLAGIFVYQLARELGARATFAVVASIGLVMSGHVLYLTTVAICVMPYLAWTAAAVLGLKRLVDRPNSIAAFVLATVSLALLCHLGLTDRTVYSWIAAGGFALGWAALRRCFVRRLPILAAVAIAAALLAMPTVFPTASLLDDSPRARPLSPQEFSSRGVKPAGLIGMVLPVYRGTDGFIEGRLTCTPYAGAWVMPALFLGLGAIAIRRRKRGEAGTDVDPDRRREAELVQAIVLLSALGALLMWLSLGTHGGLHPLTYDIPIWSRFRWPFKLYLRSILFLAIAAALCMELLVRSRFSPSRAACCVGSAILALVLWIVQPAPVTPSGLAVGIGGLASIALLGWLHVQWVRRLLLLVAVAGLGGMLSLVSYPERFKSYRDERYGSFGAAEFGISLDYRVLPVSPMQSGRSLQELGNFESATMNDYFSLTGTRAPLLPASYSKYLPAGVDGLLPPRLLPVILGSHLLRSFNTKYVIAAKYDRPVRRLLDRLPGYDKIAETKMAEVYANRDALPRVYFATSINPPPGTIQRGLIENRAPLTDAFVEGLAHEDELPVGIVQGWSWHHERISVDVSAPRGGFLVVSSSYSPDWRVTIDGAPGELRRTNGLITGVRIPPGASRIELEYDAWTLRAGLWLAGLGLATAAGVVVWQRKSGSRR